jgi:hypothetical protein
VNYYRSKGAQPRHTDDADFAFRGDAPPGSDVAAQCIWLDRSEVSMIDADPVTGGSRQFTSAQRRIGTRDDGPYVRVIRSFAVEVPTI